MMKLSCKSPATEFVKTSAEAYLGFLTDTSEADSTEELLPYSMNQAFSEDMSDKLNGATEQVLDPGVRSYYRNKAKIFFNITIGVTLKTLSILKEFVLGCLILVLVPVCYFLGVALAILRMIANLLVAAVVTAGLIPFWVVGGLYACVQICLGRMTHDDLCRCIVAFMERFQEAVQ
ncbi:hypothetical protein VKT23_005253 [Stygiomarasmius scandens]|uniref:Caveolin n=1 Tax=Marasmiellus scandens TaxID=2682957 RepID=A0ABR1JRR8_9AGAR